MKQFTQPSATAYVMFLSWLIGVLEEVVKNSVKRRGVINAEQLWSSLPSLKHLKMAGRNFWTSAKWIRSQCFINMSSMKYLRSSQSIQYVGRAQIQSNVKNVTYFLTYEEENAVTYVPGYVIHSLLQQENKSFHKIFEELVNKDKTDQENVVEEWLKAVDRGGLTRIITDAFQLFYAVETCVRQHLTVSNVKKMDNISQKHLTNCVLKLMIVMFYFNGTWLVKTKVMKMHNTVWKRC